MARTGIDQSSGVYAGEEMIALVALTCRNPQMSHEEFSRYWLHSHGPLVRSVPEFTRHLKKYVQLHVDPSRSEQGPFAGAIDVTGYDGISMLFFENIHDVEQAFNEPRYLEVIRPDEPNFADVERCMFFLLDAHTIFEALP